MAVPGFNERINIAVRIVTEKYPDAQLYEAIGIASEGPTSDPAKIDQLRVIFRNSKHSAVIIKSADYSTFEEPVLIPLSWYEDVALKWPVKMDLNDACLLKEKAGYTTPYTSVNLRNSLGPQIQKPYFVFNANHSEPNVFVDIIAEKVYSGC